MVLVGLFIIFVCGRLHEEDPATATTTATAPTRERGSGATPS